MTSQSRSLADHLLALRRRRPLLLTVASSVLALAVLAAMFWPATYRSTGTILIEQQEVPLELVRASITSYADQRIQVITQRVMTTENLLGLIKRYNLYPNLQRNSPREVLIEHMRKDVKFEMISADVVDPRQGRPVKATIAFSVSYDNRSAEVAARVANELTTLYLNENLTSRKQLSADTANFLTDETGKLRDKMAKLESQLAAFKEKHHGDLPELTQLNLQLMTRTEDELRDVDTEMRSLDQQIVYLDAQLAQISPSSQVYTSTGERVLSPQDRLKFLRTEYARVSGLYSPTHPDVVRTKREIEGLEKEAGNVDVANDLARQLEDAQTHLAEAKKKYADDHPDIVRMQRLVASIEATMKTAPATSSAVSAINKPDNPAYIQIQSQREASVNQRTSLERKRASLKDKLADYERRIQNAPAVEREYSALVRELESSQLKFRDTSQRQMEAQLSQNLESESKGEKFTLIEPPLVPEEPASPNRLAIFVLGLVLAMGAGFGAAVLMESIDGRVSGRRDLEALLSVPPLAVLPWIDTAEDKQRRTRRNRYTLAGAVGSVALSIVMIHLFFRPLDVLWAIALRRLGV